MFGMVSWFARNAVAANLVMVIAFIGGVLGFNRWNARCSRLCRWLGPR